MFRNWREWLLIRRSGYFDSRYYLLNNPDVRRADIDPLSHFIKYGWKEGRNPSEKFDINYYLQINSDVKKANINPLVHYLKFGHYEGRIPIAEEHRNDIEGYTKKFQSSDPLKQRIFGKFLKRFAKKNCFGLSIKLKYEISKKVSIVIPNYNGCNYIKECLASLKKIDFLVDQYEIIVVDNGSSDDSINFIQTFYPEIILIKSERNLGFSGGCNLGIVNSRGEYIVLLNNDTVVERNWLKEMVYVADNDPEVGIVGSKLLFKHDPHIIQNAGSYLTEYGDGGDIGFYQNDVGQYDSTREVMAACGASMLVKRELLDQIGVLDEDFSSYYEDTDLCYRARLLGKKIVFAHKSIVYHVHAATLGEWSPTFSFLVYRNKLLLHLKNSTAPFFLSVLFSYLWQVFCDVLHRHNGRVHLKVLTSFFKKLPKFFIKRFYIRELIREEKDSQVLLRLTKVKPKIKSSDIKKICIYNAYLPTLGGGEKQTANLIYYLNRLFPSATIDILIHETDTFKTCDLKIMNLLEVFKNEFNIENEKVNLRYVPIGYYNKSNRSLLSKFLIHLKNEKITCISRGYDLFINNTFSSEITARSKLNLYYCMFPTKIENHTWIKGYLYSFFKNRFLKSYHLFLANSNYTQQWIDEYWNVNSFVLYPGVADLPNINDLSKKNLIINIGRFFAGGHNKKQDILIRSFVEMCKRGWTKDWKLVLIGRKHNDEKSTCFTQSLYTLAEGYPIIFLHDISKNDLKDYLQNAKIYWHATGYGERKDMHPEKFEHFGLSTIEAMQYGAVPVVFNAGGQPEIVKHGLNGFLWNTPEELMAYTKNLIEYDDLREDISRTTINSTRIFNLDNQLEKIIQFLEWYIDFQ